jgi:hypothetical protein
MGQQQRYDKRGPPPLLGLTTRHFMTILVHYCTTFYPADQQLSRLISMTFQLTQMDA